MKKLKFICCTLSVAVCLCVGNAWGWNGTGHMTVAELAWRAMSKGERKAVSQLLRNHPHYTELLEAELVAGVDHDEWVFLRAATWPDLVRPAAPGKPAKPEYITRYHRPDWHYVDLPYILPADRATIDPAAHQPPVTNAVERLTAMEAELRSTTADVTNRAIALCWYLHLLGDVHQPLHCTSWFSPEFPGDNGDSGGNGVAIKPHSAPMKLHSFWDELLGTGGSYTFIDHTADTIETNPLLAKAKLKELKKNKTYQSWAEESFTYAGAFAYLDGELEHAKYHEHITAAEVPDLNSNYEDNARTLAQRRIAAAGIRLGRELKQIF
ncbi:MAG TPA: S1/P1 nuclease [Verrucomicrobiae bacterium]